MCSWSKQPSQPPRPVVNDGSFLRETVDGLEEHGTTYDGLSRRRINNPFVADRVLMFDSTAAGIPLNTCGRGGSAANRYRPRSVHSVQVGKLVAREAAAVAVARKCSPIASLPFPDVHGRGPAADGDCAAELLPQPPTEIVVANGGTAAAAAVVVDEPAGRLTHAVDGGAPMSRVDEQAIYDDVAPDERQETSCCMECVYCSVEICGCIIM